MAVKRSVTRTRARRAALQALYQWHLNRKSGSAISKEFASDRELNNVDVEYFDRLVREVPKHADALADALSPHLNMPWAQVTLVERAALLIGAFELLECPEIPYRVAISEAVELVKMFGAEEGYRLVNGVLDAFAAEARGAEMSASMMSADKGRGAVAPTPSESGSEPGRE